MTTALTVLQLDTCFPRVPGDVACAQSYCAKVEIIRIPQAQVSNIVTSDPSCVDIAPFADALAQARGEVIATSCGFLAYWQQHLEALTDRPFIASALNALNRLNTPADRTAILTFDADTLMAGHRALITGRAAHVVGLRPDMHLREVIKQDARALDETLAAREIAHLVAQSVPEWCNTLVLECTNLPPYKKAIADQFGGQIIDILTEIEHCRPGTVAPAFLSLTPDAAL